MTIDVNRKTVAIAVIYSLALLAAGVFAGRASYGPNIEYRERVVEKWDVKVLEKEKVVVVHVKEAKKASDRTWEKKTKPDGTVEEKVTEKVKEETKDSSVAVKEVVKVEEKIVYVDRAVEKIVEVPLQQWRVGIDVGVDALGVSVDSTIKDQPWVIGASGERRVIGPFWAGVWANNSGQLGLTGSMEF